ncbi:uncharacterized protein METZ01_LOCUS243367 [marine metagenome]|uniref:Uncharacterized protein n=1 Tax=marine metagenome TaxID=408172 RepID=A0A382HV65_9ZZZZ
MRRSSKPIQAAGKPIEEPNFLMTVRANLNKALSTDLAPLHC